MSWLIVIGRVDCARVAKSTQKIVRPISQSPTRTEVKNHHTRSKSVARGDRLRADGVLGDCVSAMVQTPLFASTRSEALSERSRFRTPRQPTQIIPHDSLLTEKDRHPRVLAHAGEVDCWGIPREACHHIGEQQDANPDQKQATHQRNRAVIAIHATERGSRPPENKGNAEEGDTEPERIGKEEQATIGGFRANDAVNPCQNRPDARRPARREEDTDQE